MMGSKTVNFGFTTRLALAAFPCAAVYSALPRAQRAFFKNMVELAGSFFQPAILYKSQVGWVWVIYSYHYDSNCNFV